jgi:hypothetical protein
MAAANPAPTEAEPPGAVLTADALFDLIEQRSGDMASPTEALDIKDGPGRSGRRSADGPHGRPPWYRRPLPVLIAAAAVAIAVIAPLALLRSDQRDVADEGPTQVPATQGPAPTLGEPPPPPPEETTPTTAVVPPPAITMTWTQAPDQEAFGRTDGIRRVIEGGPGLIAVGVVVDEVSENAVSPPEDEGFYYTHGAVWVSSDGLTWDRVGDETVFSGVPNQFGTDYNQVVTDIARGTTGYVAVGWTSTLSGDTDAPIWFSEDAIRWERITGQSEELADVEFVSVVATDEGYLAVGEQAWSSPDGRTWERVDEGGLDPDLSGRVVAVENGFAMAATRNMDGNFLTRSDLVFATSPDGAVWSATPITADRGHVSGPVIIDGRYVVGGYDSVGYTHWVSDDGQQWQRLGDIVTGFRRSVFATLPIVDDEHWIIGAMEHDVATVFASADGGMTWQTVASIEGPPDDAYIGSVDQRPPGIRDLIKFGDLFIGVGGTGNGSAPIWIGTWQE